jgi:hypothetical protein
MNALPTRSDHRAAEGGLELGPNLLLPVYYAAERWHSERIGALTLYCSDGRWGEAFDEFCHKHLQIPRYDRLAVPGGPAWLVPRGDNDPLARTACEQLDFLVRVHGLSRLVLITHYGCALYAERLGLGPDDCLMRQLDDVRNAGTALRAIYQGLIVEGYLAMRRGNCLSFHTVDF